MLLRSPMVLVITLTMTTRLGLALPIQRHRRLTPYTCILEVANAPRMSTAWHHLCPIPLVLVLALVVMVALPLLVVHVTLVLVQPLPASVSRLLLLLALWPMALLLKPAGLIAQVKHLWQLIRSLVSPQLRAPQWRKP